MLEKDHNATVVLLHCPSYQLNLQRRLVLLPLLSLFFSSSTAMSQILPLQGAALQEIILLELEGLYISCQPRRLLFFLPIEWHLQVNRLSGCGTLRYHCPISSPTLSVGFLDVHTCTVSTPDMKDTYSAV